MTDLLPRSYAPGRPNFKIMSTIRYEFEHIDIYMKVNLEILTHGIS